MTIREYKQNCYDLRISEGVAGVTDLEAIPLYIIRETSPTARNIYDLDQIQLGGLLRQIQQAYRWCQRQTVDSIPKNLGMNSTPDDYTAASLGVVLVRYRGVSDHDICVTMCVFDTQLLLLSDGATGQRRPSSRPLAGATALPPANSNGELTSGDAPANEYNTRLSGLMARCSNTPARPLVTSSSINDRVRASTQALSELDLEGDVDNERSIVEVAVLEVLQCIWVFSCMLVWCINLRVCIC